ncbi:molybdate ABC transporter substrate-binding protein [Fulvivirgaceae bacterium BMA12]|uniref:Molybdate ABC transporter substrate-binding protein n=1 Tax=Agaribacillus aureus TaxID=3051825 RepID=A0ABT8L7C8_9BACT|nr:molybdate ABC transporter substrate-binding protein [Fulvivirgaceae bacterium BMA12]
MKSGLKKCLFLAIAIQTSCQFFDKSSEHGTEALTVYCAAGIKPAMEKVAREYQSKYGVQINLQYGGSGTLLTNLTIAQQGDLYLAADESYIEKAVEKSLLAEVQPLAFIRPVIAFAKENPLNIENVAGLKRQGIKLAIANPEAASIGRVTKSMLSNSGDWEEVFQNVMTTKPTVNEIANDIKIGTIDVGIIWDAVASQYENVAYIEVPDWEKYRQQVTIGVLKTSKNPKEALKFMRYVSARDKGLRVFKSLGYHPVKGDIWEENPQLLFYSGGVNRLAVEKTIKGFEEREGVEVVRVYNGCGILVSQIKAGQNPDAYLSCDVSFMTQVQGLFQNIENISSTRIVILTRKDDSHQLSTLQDLTIPGLKLGVCNPQQSALGALTESLLRGSNLLNEVMENVVVQTPTADLLVNQLQTGALDAAVVYEANVAHLGDEFKVVSLDLEKALAIQNLGISTNSKHKFLARRLYQAIVSDSSRSIYLNNGFDWQHYSN